MYFTLAIITLVISAFLFKKSAGSLSLTKLNLHGLIFYYHLVLQAWIGVTLAIYYLDNHYIISKIPDEKYRVITFFLVMLTMILLPLTMVIVNKIIGFDAVKEYNEYLNAPMQFLFNDKDRKVFVVVLFFTILSMCSIFYTFYIMKQIPLLEAFQGKSSLELAKIRQDASSRFEGNHYIRNLLALILMPLLSYISYAYFRINRDKKWLILFGLQFIFTIIIKTYDLSKMPVLWYLISLIILNIIINGKIKKKTIMISGLGLSLLVVLLYILLFDNLKLSNFAYNVGPIGRLIFSQIAGLYFHIYVFTEELPLLLGSSFPQWMISIFDKEHVRSASIIIEYTHPESVEKGIAGVMNTLFIGEAFANFGYVGVIIGIILAGIVLQLLYIVFIKSKKTPVIIAAFIYFIMNFSAIITGGIVEFIYNVGMIFVVIICLSIYLFSKLLYKVTERRKMREDF